MKMYVCLFVLITGYPLLRAPPREWIFACTAVCTPASRAVVLRLDFGEVHAGYVSVAGTDIIAWTSVSGSFKSEYDFVHVHSD